MQRFYRKAGPEAEYCFNIETCEPLTPDELRVLRWLLAETFEPEQFSDQPFLTADRMIIEVGPRLNFETPFSTNAVAICHACGLSKITRLERSRRYLLPGTMNKNEYARTHHDRMTENLYESPLTTFATGLQPESVYEIPLIEQGSDALWEFNKKFGLGWDDWDIDFYSELFTKQLLRNPTNVEGFQLGQMNSEHSRHPFFKGQLTIDGLIMPQTLMQLVKSTLQANPGNSLIAFKDNSSAIKGFNIWTIIPRRPGQCSDFTKQPLTYHIIFTAETHNHPSGVAPFPGAETGTGGRIRDVQATGRGALVIAGTVGYCVGNLNIFDFPLPGENPRFTYPANLATPLRILIEESNGASDYGNKFGEPVIQGFVRTFGQILPDGDRREWIKPIMFTGGVGQIDARHTEKIQPKKSMLIIQIGGPAYKIGLGGGGASSQISGENTAELDFASVQRGDAEMEQKMNRVVRACVEMGYKNPIASLHDQGAGGPCNVITELVTPAGGKIEIREIIVGDKTMSVITIWCAEYQERNALLIRPDRLTKFQSICRRENVNCEVLGEITNDGHITVHDSHDGSLPVDLNLGPILENMPQKKFNLRHLPLNLQPLRLPDDLSVETALQLIFSLPAVGSKGYLTRKVDRSVTGLIARQQCCGPLQLPVSDVAVIAQSHFGLTGAATAIGEQPIKMLVNPAAGARMAVGEALTNIVWAYLTRLEDIKCSANWMWPAKQPGEGALLYDAAQAMADLMIQLGIAIDGGKDSLSMAAKVGDAIVKAPGQLVISAYATVPDITKVITPDLKRPGVSRLLYLDLGSGKNRLGGSALAQVFDQIGDDSPDLDDPMLLANAFRAVQELIIAGYVLAGHDRSDGGLITTLAEMAMSGNCGLDIELTGDQPVINQLFSEELGLVIEYQPEFEPAIIHLLKKWDVPYQIIGRTCKEPSVTIQHQGQIILNLETEILLKWWESTSDRLEQEQMNPMLSVEQSKLHNRSGLTYRLSFAPRATPTELLDEQNKPKVAIIRVEGSNGDREMTSAFYRTGFEPWDITMTDLLNGTIGLDQFRGMVFVGGFSYADVLDSAKGWAGIIRFNTKLREIFDRFYNRPDTFSLGVCNGCQLMALLGWVPWPNISEPDQPRFVRNLSGRFESRWVGVQIKKSPAIMLKNMAGAVLGIWVAHGEGRLHASPEILAELQAKNLAPLRFIDGQRKQTGQYPFNPNGSPFGITALCSPDGRHLAMMPHPERSFLTWQWPWLPASWKKMTVSPWLRLFQNAYDWCQK